MALESKDLGAPIRANARKARILIASLLARELLLSETGGVGFARQSVIPLIIGVAAALALLGLAAYTSYTLVLAIIAAAVVSVVLLHFWNKRPVKMPGDDVRLNLDRDSKDELRK